MDFTQDLQATLDRLLELNKDNKGFWTGMASAKVIELINAFNGLKTANADLAAQLATALEEKSAALADDAADDAAIAAATEEATAARAQADELSAQVANLQAQLDVSAQSDAEDAALIDETLAGQ